jgi:hypothetical protein
VGAGLFHANCTHRTGLYIEGLTEDVGNDAAQSEPQAYEDRQRQRSLERQERKWRRRLAVAIDDGTERAAQAKVTEYRERLRLFVQGPDAAAEAAASGWDVAHAPRQRRRDREYVTRGRAGASRVPKAPAGANVQQRFKV